MLNDKDAMLLAAAILLAHELSPMDRREATEAEVQFAVTNAQRVRDELEKRERVAPR
jgi:hypothetical protein